MRLAARLKVVSRRYGVPLAVGLFVLVADRIVDGFLEPYHLPGPVMDIDDVLIALVVACAIYILQQRYDNLTIHLQRFTSDTAHQLRTSLSILQSIGDIGLRGSFGAAQYQGLFGEMVEEVARLNGLVDALLFLARLDAGQVRPVRTKLRVDDLVREVAESLEVLAQEKSQELSLNTDTDALIEADQTMLRQAIMNLVDNSIKYTPEGGAIAVETRRGHGRHVEIIVSDNGPGLEPEDQVRIFDRFYRRASDHLGIGLGLSISQAIIKAHKGTIRCDGAPGRGCRFTIQIPACEYKAAIRSAPSLSNQTSAGRL